MFFQLWRVPCESLIHSQNSFLLACEGENADISKKYPSVNHSGEPGAIHPCRPEASCQISVTAVSRYLSCSLKQKIRLHAFLMSRTHTAFISRSQSWRAHKRSAAFKEDGSLSRKDSPGCWECRVPSAGATVGLSCRGRLHSRTCPSRASLRPMVDGR